MTDGFSVRVATPEDERLVSELLKASYPALMPQGYDQATLEAVLPLITQANPALLSSGTYYLAVSEDGQIVGCGGWTKERPPGTGDAEAGLGHIRHFATHPQWLRRGIGRAIYDMCENDAQSAGIRRFECYASLNAEGFYTALGFNLVRRIDVPMGPSLTSPSLLMERPIP